MPSRGFSRQPSSKRGYPGWRRRRSNENASKIAQAGANFSRRSGARSRVPGLSQEDAEREARAMIERGEIAADDFVLGIINWSLGPVRIRPLPCTTAEYCAWL